MDPVINVESDLHQFVGTVVDSKIDSLGWSSIFLSEALSEGSGYAKGTFRQHTLEIVHGHNMYGAYTRRIKSSGKQAGVLARVLHALDFGLESDVVRAVRTEGPRFGYVQMQYPPEQSLDHSNMVALFDVRVV